MSLLFLSVCFVHGWTGISCCIWEVLPSRHPLLSLLVSAPCKDYGEEKLIFWTIFFSWPKVWSAWHLKEKKTSWILMLKLQEVCERLQSFWSKLFQTLQVLQIWGSRLQVKGKEESKADWRTSTAVATACFARRINWDIKRKSWLLFNQNWLSGARKYQPQKVRTSDFIFFTIV